MANKDNIENIPKIPDKIIAYVSGCSQETVRKVKYNKRRDKFNISQNSEQIAEFLRFLKRQNSN